MTGPADPFANQTTPVAFHVTRGATKDNLTGQRCNAVEIRLAGTAVAITLMAPVEVSKDEWLAGTIARMVEAWPTMVAEFLDTLEEDR